MPGHANFYTAERFHPGLAAQWRRWPVSCVRTLRGLSIAKPRTEGICHGLLQWLSLHQEVCYVPGSVRGCRRGNSPGGVGYRLGTSERVEKSGVGLHLGEQYRQEHAASAFRKGEKNGSTLERLRGRARRFFLSRRAQGARKMLQGGSSPADHLLPGRPHGRGDSGASGSAACHNSSSPVTNQALIAFAVRPGLAQVLHSIHECGHRLSVPAKKG